jgi:formamidopyrimidine-DNA glycosylase
MPELPEVETIRRCISPETIGRSVTQIVIRNPNLRWPVSDDFAHYLSGQKILAVQRRAKYLLLRCEAGSAIIHLGMSGRLLICSNGKAVTKHDHLDIVLDNGKLLRLNDPRRFGCVLWTSGEPWQHPLLKDLGLEPLEDDLTGAYLYRQSRRRSVSIKEFVMNSRIIVGVGNIYANEALFAAGILPSRQVNRISLKRYERLVASIKSVLTGAIQHGGTTFRDFCDADGNPGNFQFRLMVYDRAGQFCYSCGTPIHYMRLAQRSTYFCRKCQR